MPLSPETRAISLTLPTNGILTSPHGRELWIFYSNENDSRTMIKMISPSESRDSSNWVSTVMPTRYTMDRWKMKVRPQTQCTQQGFVGLILYGTRNGRGHSCTDNLSQAPYQGVFPEFGCDFLAPMTPKLKIPKAPQKPLPFAESLICIVQQSQRQHSATSWTFNVLTFLKKT